MKIQNLFLSRQIFDDWNCQFYGAGDMALSLFEIGLATAIAFDRYIVTKNPKWGKQLIVWRFVAIYSLQVRGGVILTTVNFFS